MSGKILNTIMNGEKVALPHWPNKKNKLFFQSRSLEHSSIRNLLSLQTSLLDFLKFPSPPRFLSPLLVFETFQSPDSCVLGFRELRSLDSSYSFDCSPV